MYSEVINAVGDNSAASLAAQRRSLVGHFVRSMLAGMYVGSAITLIFTIGAYVPAEWRRLVMGVCFGGALTTVIFAGSELFTGANMIHLFGVCTRKITVGKLLSSWFWTFLGNFAGSVLFALIVWRTGLLDIDPVRGFVTKLVAGKMNLAPEPLFWRAVLANWLVCLGVWMATRIKDDTTRLLMIWWCMFTFITCGYEHSVANMCGLLLGLLLPHGEAVTWSGYGYNLVLATVGNVVGGVVFVGGMYWVGSAKGRAPGSFPGDP